MGEVAQTNGLNYSGFKYAHTHTYIYTKIDICKRICICTMCMWISAYIYKSIKPMLFTYACTLYVHIIETRMIYIYYIIYILYVHFFLSLIHYCSGWSQSTKLWPTEFQGVWTGWTWLNHQPETKFDCQGRKILIDLDLVEFIGTPHDSIPTPIQQACHHWGYLPWIDCCCVLSTWKLSHPCGALYLLMSAVACLIACQ